MIVTIIFLLNTCFAGPVAKPKIEKITAEAVNADGELLYTEKDTMEYQGKLQSEVPIQIDHRFYTPKGDFVAEVHSDFRKSKYLPDYHYYDRRAQRGGGLKFNPALPSLELFRRTSEKDIETRPYEYKENMISGMGVYFYIRDHVDSLIKGEKKHIRIVVPTRFDDYGFRIRLVSDPVESPNYITLRIEIDSWILRLFAPSVEVDYDRTRMRVMEYRGPASILDENGKRQIVKVKFRYF